MLDLFYMRTKTALLRLLAKEGFHSGARLAAQLGINRAALRRDVRALQPLLDIEARPGKGYRLRGALELLDGDAIRAALPSAIQPLLSELEILEEVDSTNLYLLRRAKLGAAGGHACLAECQRAGRGRHGRVWTSPFGTNIYLSVLWRFDAAPAPGLSLAMGVAVARALRAAGVKNPALKWPNDVLWQGRKLAGILVDQVSAALGSYCVIGVGVNTVMPRAAIIDQPWVDMQTILGAAPARNRCAAHLLEHVLAALQKFQYGGLVKFMEEWNSLDAYAGKPVSLRRHDSETNGVALGIDAHGALRLRARDGQVHCYACGDVSLRPSSTGIVDVALEH
ncbi:MAG: biotin--[acetyl-CoA-carboxylase] ligase [Pseudomonadota bacterium]